VNEDQVLSNQDVTTGTIEDRLIASSVTPESPGFPAMLEHLRESRGLSKAELAKRTGYDPSTITRFEQGSRAPDRSAVLQLAQAMTLPLEERDRLLASAGFRSVLWDDAQLIELVGLLSDSRIPLAVRNEARTVINLAISHLKLARIEH